MGHKKVWSVPVAWTMVATLKIEAETLDEAIAKANADDGPLPEGAYLEDSWHVDGERQTIADEYN